MRRGKASFARHPKFPFLRAARGIYGIEVAVIASEIDGTSVDRGRRCHAPFRFELPLLRARSTIDRIQKVIAAPHINSVPGDRGRRNNMTVGAKLPLHFDRLRYA